MAAQLSKPHTKPTKPRTKTQAIILKTKAEHPDLTVREIAAIADCSHVNVVTTLQRYGIKQENIDNFKRTRADILAGLQDKLLSSITNENVQQASMLQKVTASAILFDKERLERDLSTSNTASVFGDIAALKGIKPVDK
jgi:hypothetical protein